MSTKQEIINRVVKENPSIKTDELEKMTKKEIAELRLKLKSDNAPILKKDAFAHLFTQDPEPSEISDPEPSESAENSESEVEITDEMCAAYRDEENELFCGVFANPDLNSPICNKDCKEMYEERFLLCNALAAQKEAEKKRQSKKKSGGGKKSGMKQWIANAIQEGRYTKEQLVDMYMTAFPEGAKSTATTYISDGISRKYCPFDYYVVIDKETRIVKFSDEKAPGSRKKSEELWASTQN